MQRVTAATMAVAVAMAMARDSCVEGICVVDAAAGAMTAVASTAVKAAQGEGGGDSCGKCNCFGSGNGDGHCGLVVWCWQRRRWQQRRLGT